jgi:hypothetical protein
MQDLVDGRIGGLSGDSEASASQTIARLNQRNALLAALNDDKIVSLADTQQAIDLAAHKTSRSGPNKVAPSHMGFVRGTDLIAAAVAAQSEAAAHALARNLRATPATASDDAHASAIFRPVGTTVTSSTSALSSLSGAGSMREASSATSIGGGNWRQRVVAAHNT